MTSSLHVSLPDELRQFVDHRTDGRKDFSTPSEYIRSLIRSDMDKEAEKLYVYKALLQGAAEIDRREIVPESVFDILNEP